MGKVKYLPLYVGSSRNIRTRLSSHELYKEFIKNFDNVDCYYIYSERYKDIEVLLINELRPIFNYQFNKKYYLRHG